MVPYLSHLYASVGREVGPLNWTQEHKSVWERPASKATGHGPRPARDWPVPKSACVQAWARTAGHCAVQSSWPVRTFSKSAILHRFPNFLHAHWGSKFSGWLLSVHVYLWPLWTMKSFMEIGPHVFEKSGRQTQTDATTLYSRYGGRHVLKTRHIVECDNNCLLSRGVQ